MNNREWQKQLSARRRAESLERALLTALVAGAVLLGMGYIALTIKAGFEKAAANIELATKGEAPHE